jgi:hypothetical protein
MGVHICSFFFNRLHRVALQRRLLEENEMSDQVSCFGRKDAVKERAFRFCRIKRGRRDLLRTKERNRRCKIWQGSAGALGLGGARSNGRHAMHGT